MLFEWDENNRQSNVREHGLDLIRGAELFDGRPVITYASPRSDESRFVTVGLLMDQFVAVVWTQREDAVRLISLRRARNAEKTAYLDSFG